VGCLVLPIVLFAGCVGGLLGVLGTAKNADVYKQALARAQASPAVQRELGAPITAGMVSNANVNTNNGVTTWDLTSGLNGSRQSGRLHVVGTKRGERTVLRTLTVTSDRGRTLNLLSAAAPAGAGAPASP
jgi:hypothetical protein